MTRQPSRLAAAAPLLLALSSASATDAQDMAAMLKEWVGKPEAALLAAWGQPAQSTERGRNRIVGYFGESSRPSMSAGGFTTVAGGKAGCVVTFEIDPRGVVAASNWSTEGAADRARARKACWREFRRNAPQ